MKKQLELNPQELPNFVIFKIDHAKINVDVLFENNTLWLTQKKMAELFGTTPQNITSHLKNIYKEELFEDSTCKEFLQVQQEGKRQVKRTSKYYALKAITAVGYRVNSLLDNGKVTALEAKLKAHNEYEKYRVIQDKKYLSDFDNLLNEIESK